MKIKILISSTLMTLGLIAAQSAYGQFWDKLSNPDYDVPITHPPQVALKAGEKIVVQTFSGKGADELSMRFSTALTEGGKFEIIDRANLQSVMQEQGIQSGNSIDPDSAMKLGKLLGAKAMFVGRMARCGVELSAVLHGQPYNSGSKNRPDYHTDYTVRATARISGNVQLVDLTTGKTIASKMVEATKTLENTAQDGPPEPPSKDEALDQAYKLAIEQLNRIILPWNETVKLIVYDDKKMGLNTSAGQIKAGDFEGAVKTLQITVDAGMTDTKEAKTYSKVYYNLGIAQMYSGQPDNAIKSLSKASELRSTDIIDTALKTARQMQQLQKQAETAESHALDLGKEEKPAASTAGESAKSRLTNKDVLSMVKAKLPDVVIISKMKNSACQIDTSPDALIALKEAGASDAVILEITQLPANQKEK